MNWLDGLKLPITDPTWIFLLVLLIILFAPIVLNKLRIPHIIGMILAGLLVGEHGLDILARDSSFELFGKVGLYYIMFLAGLEMNMADFKKNRGKAVLLGLLAFIIPIGIGLAANMSLLRYTFVSSLLLASMYASHTLVAYPIVIRYGVSRQRSVSVAVGGTAVTDTLTLLVLAVVGGLFKGEGGGLYWMWLVVKVVLLGVFIMYGMPYIARRFFRRYSDGVMQFIFVLAMVFLGAGIMQFVGMEGILGAFLAGLALNRLIPHVSPLMNHLEFVGNALFIPYFLIGVGMMIDLHVIFGGGDALKVAAVMIVVALAGKWIASWLTQKICRMSGLERKLMFGLSNAQAAATLAAVLVGYNIILPGGERLLNDDVLNGTVLLILVTCIVSSLTTEHAARQMALTETVQEKEPTDRTERFLIPLGNPHSIESLMNLALLVRDPKQTDNLMALNVINDANASDALEVRGRRCLEQAAMITASAGVTLRQGIRYGTTVATGILHASKEFEATDIIIGLHHKVNIVDSFYGALTEELLRGLDREVMIARFLVPINTVKRIIVAVPPKAEFEAGARKWVGHFCRMGSSLGCRVHFFAGEKTLRYLQALTAGRYSKTLTDFSLLEDWDDLLLMTGEVSYDNLFVVITARKGAISYDNSFEKLPDQLDRYFSNNSLIVLYPDQLGERQEFMTFLNPRSVHDAQYYERVGRWFYRWFKSGPKSSSGGGTHQHKASS